MYITSRAEQIVPAFAKQTQFSSKVLFCKCTASLKPDNESLKKAQSILVALFSAWSTNNRITFQLVMASSRCVSLEYRFL